MKERGEIPEYIPTEIKEMPDKQTLEKFMEGFNGQPVEVVFNRDEGKFEWLIERPEKEPPLGQAKTEFGKKLRHL